MAKPKTARTPDPTLTPLQVVQRRLEAAGSRTNYLGNWTCPAHDDKRPSLSVSDGDDGRVLLHCHAGCELADILRALGLEAGDLFPVVFHPQLGRAVAIYTYLDERGGPLFQVCRFDRPKTFRPRRLDGAWNLDGVRLVPYRLPTVVAAVRGGRPVYVVEGEKDADALDRAGLAATTNPGGASKWRPEYGEHFRGANVVVVADRDGAGYKHAAQVADALRPVAASVRVVESKDGKDATDHLEAGHSAADFVPVVEAPVVGPQDTARLLEQVAAFARRFVVFRSDGQLVAVALWVLHTHAFKASDTTPYLHVHSAAKRSGKSRLLEVVELLVPRPERAAIISAPALFRLIEDELPTLLLDEVDAIFKGKADESNEALRAVLNAGYRFGTMVPRVGGTGAKRTVERFSTYCPKALAGIGKLPDTVGDRCIPVELQRRKPTERVEPFYYRDVSAEAGPLRLALATWGDGAVGSLAAARPARPEELNDRAADVWEPLLAIADLAGGDWPAKARAAAVELHPDEDDEGNNTVTLLRHIREAFADAQTEYLPTEALLRGLVDREDGPWADWWGRDVADNQTKGPAAKLARMLKPFGPEPKLIKRSGRTFRGYLAAMFEEAWARYLPAGNAPPPENVVTPLPRRSEAVLAPDPPNHKTGSDQGGNKVTTFSDGGTVPRGRRLKKRKDEQLP